jgi:hypothetical protein
VEPLGWVVVGVELGWVAEPLDCVVPLGACPEP